MSKNSTSGIGDAFLKNMFLTAFITIILTFGFWIHNEYTNFDIETKSLKANHIEKQKNYLKNQVNRVTDYIYLMMHQSEKGLMDAVKDKTIEAHNIATNIYRQNPQKISSEKIVINVLSPIKIYNGEGHIFIFDLHKKKWVRPITCMNKEMISDNIQTIVNEKLEGHHVYCHPPSNRPGRQKKIILYTKLFKPLNWIIGSICELEAVLPRTQNEILERIVTMRFHPEGYFFGSTYGGDPLFSNGVITKGTSSIRNLTDPNGIEIFSAMKEAASASDGEFISYSWHKLNSSEPSPKISYVKGIEEWGWIIGAGAYSDTIQKKLSEKKVLLRKNITNKLFKTLFLFGVIICLILLWLRHIYRRIQSNIDTFSSFFKKAATENVTMNTEKLYFKEFKSIAWSVNQMLNDRLEAEKALIKSKKALLRAERLTKMGNWEWTAENDTLEWSEQMYNIMGFEPGSPIPSREEQRQLYPPEDWEKINRLMEQVFTGKLPSTFEVRLLKNNGGIKNIFANVRPNLDPEGQPIGLFGTYQDITYRKKTEKALIESEERYRTLFEYTPEGVISTLPDGTVISANPACAKIYGCEHAEKLIGMSMYDIYSNPSERADILAKLHKTGELKDYEMTMKTKGGQLRRVMASMKIIKDSSNIPVRLDGIFKDITEKIKLEEQLRQVYKMEAIGTLAGGIAHDFNNILGIIIGNTELAKDEMPEWSPGRENLDEILIASFRARQIIKQLLSFSRNTSQTKKPINIVPMIKESVSLLRASIPSTIEIRSHIPKNVKAIDADPTQIHQVLINLCTNSAHAMEEKGGTLDIWIKETRIDEGGSLKFHELQKGDYIQITIKDTGHGIAPELLDRIFEPYFTTKESGKGTGMGLSVVHGIIKNHQGSISIQSTPLEGTQVEILFPAIEQKPDSPELKDQGLPEGTEKILLVDDEAPITQMNSQILKSLGYSVEAKTSPIEALNLFYKNPEAFDLLITDMTMPQMTGEDLALAILKRRPAMPIILCTGFSEKMDEKRAIKMGIRKYIEKPVNKMDLALAIREVLDSSQKP